MPEARAPAAVITCATAPEAAAAAAQLLVGALADAVTKRGTATLAVSGGRTPELMLSELASTEADLGAVEVFQVDERQVSLDSPDRNAASLQPLLRVMPAQQVHLMPIGPDLDAAAVAYARTLADAAGDPPVLDAVHLGLGSDGHTASLVPGDPARLAEQPVTATAVYQGHRRLTLTAPVLRAARTCVLLVTGADKQGAVAELCSASLSSVAASVIPPNTTLVVDRDAAGLL